RDTRAPDRCGLRRLYALAFPIGGRRPSIELPGHCCVQSLERIGADELAAVDELRIADPERLIQHDSVRMIFSPAGFPPGQAHADGIAARQANVLDELA